MWDERYASEEFVYGTEPNDFLRESVRYLPAGKVLCLAEGEGRNSVFLAASGYRVTAVDSSGVGLAKARRLAESRGLAIETLTTDLGEYRIAPESWDGVVSIFCHIPSSLRCKIHAAVVAGLKPGGVLILEGYTPKQLEYGTGGPPNPALLMSLAGLKSELAGLEFLHGVELVREVVEGRLHTGMGAVVQVIARKKV
ncbi:MAG: class I SAM-dependent methyltransferase [Desulfobulbaceae bacterium]|nr:class I SAM-dependent methyltransferase [Desulfobulbaceae bacterium]